MDGAVHSNYIGCMYHLKVEVSVILLCQLHNIMFNPLHSSANQELFKSTSVINIATMKNMIISIMERKPSHATTKSTLFTVTLMYSIHFILYMLSNSSTVGEKRFNISMTNTQHASSHSSSTSLEDVPTGVLVINKCCMAAITTCCTNSSIGSMPRMYSTTCGMRFGICDLKLKPSLPSQWIAILSTSHRWIWGGEGGTKGSFAPLSLLLPSLGHFGRKQNWESFTLYWSTGNQWANIEITVINVP